MDTTMSDVKMILSDKKSILLEKPIINANSLDHLIEEGWNLILSHMSECVPSPIVKMVQNISCFEYYRRMMLVHGGMVEHCDNEMADELIFDYINVMGELDWWR